MIVYNTKDIVNRAKQLADLQNCNFISYNENLSLLNEAYTKMYQKSIDLGDTLYLKEASLIPFKEGCSSNCTAYCLPEDFYELYNLSDSNGLADNVIPRKVKNGSSSTRSYEIKRNKIYIYGSPTSDIKMEYFPIPKTLTLKAEDLDLSAFGIEGIPVAMTKTKLLTCIKKNTTFIVYNIDESIEEICRASPGKDIEISSTNEFYCTLADNGLVISYSEVAASDLNKVRFYGYGIFGEQSNTLILQQTVPMSDADWNDLLKKIKTYTFMNNGKSCLTYFNSLGLLGLETGEERIIPEDKYLFSDKNNGYGLNFVEKKSPDPGDPTISFNVIINEYTPDFSKVTHTITLDSDSGIGLANDLLFSEITFLDDDYVYFTRSFAWSSYYIKMDRNTYELIKIPSEGNVFRAFGNDLSTGYGKVLIEGMTQPGSLYVDDDFGIARLTIVSDFEDTELDYPNNFYYSYMAYLLAISYKAKQNADFSALSMQLAEIEKTYYDTIHRDVNNFIRINNVY